MIMSQIQTTSWVNATRLIAQTPFIITTLLSKCALAVQKGVKVATNGTMKSSPAFNFRVILAKTTTNWNLQVYVTFVALMADTTT